MIDIKRDDYTFEEWLEMDNNDELELIDGKIYMRGEPSTYMIGETSTRHQRVSLRLTLALGNFLVGKTCELFCNPFVVKLEEKTVVHPDLAVICDTSKINDGGCIGAPDLIIEILTPSSAGYDIFTKYNEYLLAGVKEYWIADPIKNYVIVHTLKNSDYDTILYLKKDILPVSTLPGCEIILEKIFD
ncbi:MAG: Uma2 family endonuclease [Oscillospiraceae bacterium]|nr:Uma2 family endonuclease [Oscillospiraceae bacterium]